MKLYLSSFRNGNKPEELLKLLGNGRKTAVICNAKDDESDSERATYVRDELDRLKSLGLSPEELDLRDYFANNHELPSKLGTYDLVWARGGNAFILRRAFRQSGLDQVLPDLIRSEEVVFGGYSAGIDMLTPSLHGSELVDDPSSVPNRYDSEVVWECLSLLPYALAPHYKSDHPESADIDNLVDYFIEHHLPFIALRDGEAIIVDGQSSSVVS